MAAVSGLEPKQLWSNFAQLAEIPRPSKKEEKVLVWLQKIAEELKLEYVQDQTGNMVIKRPGSGGGEAAAPVLIQGHIDMVTESNEPFDFENKAIELVRDGDYITANGTTLGADNGIGVAAALALLQMPRSAKLPPLECLFTVDEETGLTGAKQLNGEMLSAKTMLNLDTEEWGSVYVGCAGGGDSVITVPATHETLTGEHGDFEAFSLKISGLKGGHSGIDIASGRSNAVRLAAVVIMEAVSLFGAENVLVVDIKGGNKRNAIARECTATICVRSDSETKLRELCAEKSRQFSREFGSVETGLKLELSPDSNIPSEALTATSTRALLCLLTSLPHGVIRMSPVIGDLVETSSNMAAICYDEKEKVYTLTCSTRSSVASALENVRLQIKMLAEMCGGTVSQPEAYPGWQPNLESKIVKVTSACYESLTSEKPKLLAIHAGLECGLINDRCGITETVSFGPTIHGAHSPDEKVEIATVAPFFELVVAVLGELADAR